MGLHGILIWPDIRPPDIRPISLPDTGYLAGYPAKNKFDLIIKKIKYFLFTFFSFSFIQFFFCFFKFSQFFRLKQFWLTLLTIFTISFMLLPDIKKGQISGATLHTFVDMFLKPEGERGGFVGLRTCP